MKMPVLASLLFVFVGAESPLLGDPLTETQAFERYGNPSLTRLVDGEKWHYYLGQTKTPDFILKIKNNFFFELKWSFSKHPVIAVDERVLVKAVAPDDILKIGGDIRQWFDEIDCDVSWKDLDLKSRVFFLDYLVIVAGKFGATSVQLRIDHPFVSFLTSGAPERFGRVIQVDGRRTLDILSVIKERRETLLNK